MKTDNTSKLLIILTAIFLVSLMMGCIEEPFAEEPEIEDEMMDSIIETESIESDDNCPNGGFLLKAGNDSNENGLLDEQEVTTINFLCHGENGQVAADLISKTEEIPSGENCSDGGVIIYFGSDLNADSELSEDEVQSSFSLCHGEEGSSGNDGMTTLTKITDEASGDNCQNGGIKIESGMDKDENLILGNDEIETTHFICNGIDGMDGFTSLTKTLEESPGSNCDYGGIQVLTGLDRNANGQLDDDEVESTSYVCDGATAQSQFIEYYFSNGLDNYQGTSDVSIAKLGNEGLDEEELFVESEINPANGFMYATNSLIHFEGVESALTELNEEEYEVVEAILYVRVETPIIDGGEPNALGVQVIVPNAPLFKESEANWNMAYTDQEWFDPGAADVESSAYDYSDMVLLPDPTQMKFKGTVPFLLNRSQIKEWIESKDNNKGLVLTLIDQSKEYNLSIASTESDEISYRPMLYVKVKKITNELRYHLPSDNEYKQSWLQKSSSEKLEAYHNIF
ncbi:DUF7151 family protein [Reichenbachiella sp.]|uniref:DUF7151 family protein n=1 Tax=Reichenbachiella sp. TaxID=2184521 RepID=UPI003BB15346